MRRSDLKKKPPRELVREATADFLSKPAVIADFPKQRPLSIARSRGAAINPRVNR